MPDIEMPLRRSFGTLIRALEQGVPAAHPFVEGELLLGGCGCSSGTADPGLAGMFLILCLALLRPRRCSPTVSTD